MARKLDTIGPQLCIFENAVTGNIGNRHFCGGYQVEILLGSQLEQIFLKLGQLPGALQRLSVDNIGNVDFLVAVLLRMQVEHELSKRAMQSGQFAVHDSKARAGNLTCRFAVQLL